jgi:hypothetical protein
MGVMFLSNLDVVAQHLATGSRQVNVAYIVEEDGSLRRAAAVEDTDHRFWARSGTYGS